jgi:peptide/nickel transport system permease protein
VRDYIIKRILLIFPTMFIFTLVVFIVIRLIPGSIIDLIAAEMNRVGVSADRSVIAHRLGLDVPIYVQYGRWIANLFLHGDLGSSMWRNTPVIDEILARWPITLELGVMALVLSQLIALPIGIYSAIRQDSVGDLVARSFAILCIAVPGFWLATLVMVFPSIWWRYMPPIIYIPFLKDPLGNLQMFIIPSLVLSMSMAGGTMRFTRTMMLEVLRQDYVRTAWAKGLEERPVIMRHALRNALIPVVTIIGAQVPILIGGEVIIEQIFDLPGLGRLVIEAVVFRDYPLIIGIMLVFGVGLLLINLIVDLTYAFLDPRIRYT